ncbi:MAG TPA: FAD-binding protein, partial [Pyrinomonadaceae bacterium]|nr:FAD-binding protein [Pyrinomonadaceae bacterium]
MNFKENWAGNLKYISKQHFQPENVEQIQELIKNSKRIKTLGSRHCFNAIADCDEIHLSLEKLNKIVSIDEKKMTIIVEGGAQYSDFCLELNKAGYALPNLASLANISVVGACATATHGSGVTNRSLASTVSAIEFVSGNGEIINLNKKTDGEKFNGAVVNLGSLGIVTKITLDVEKTYSVRQDLFENLQLDILKENFDEIMASGYSVSLFTNFQNKNIRVVNIKRRVDEKTGNLPNDFFGATPATESINSRGIPDKNRSPQMGTANFWFECLPH